jgi:uncharacterized repeat protein (TIGR03803 family)
VETVLYSFGDSQVDGEFPVAALIQASDGSFWGTTYGGGAVGGGYGTVFRITPAGVETVMHAFVGGSSDGAQPDAALIQAGDGNFYGTTTYGGGTSQLGTVFSITPAGVETVTYFFAVDSSDGGAPSAPLIQGSDGNLYGTTQYGGPSGYGTVFKMAPQ